MTDTTTSDPGCTMSSGSGPAVAEHEHLAGAGIIKPGYAPRLAAGNGDPGGRRCGAFRGQPDPGPGVAQDVDR